jgi:enterochelin esterase-like enzyme
MRSWKFSRRVLLVLLGIVFCCVGVLAQTGGGRLVDDSLDSPALAANLLGDPARRAVSVYLPPGYDQEGARRYPVIYWLHGFKARNRLWTGPGQPGRGLGIQELADDLINRGVIQPLIIVMPDGANAYGGSFYLNSTVTGNWEDFICRDLVDYMDRTYRTIPEAGARGLAGHSMGGYGAVILGMRHPEIFSAVYAQSPACLVFAEHFLKLQRANLVAAAKLVDRDRFLDLEWRDQVIIAAGAAVAPDPKKPPWLADFPLAEVNGEPRLNEAVWQRWLRSDPYTLLEPLKSKLARLKLAFEMGTADRMLPQAQMLHQALDQLGLPHTYEEYQGDHISHVRERLHDRVLPFFSKALQGKRGKRNEPSGE